MSLTEKVNDIVKLAAGLKMTGGSGMKSMSTMGTMKPPAPTKPMSTFGVKSKGSAVMGSMSRTPKSPSMSPDVRGLSSKMAQAANPWAICTSSVGREDKDKYERCVLKVKKKHGITE